MPKPNRFGRIIVALLILSAIVTLIWSTMTFRANREQAYFNQAGVAMTTIHKEMNQWSAEGRIGYPPHVAILIVDGRLTVEQFRDPRRPGGGVWGIGSIDLRQGHAEQQDAVVEALRTMPATPIYFFGDFWFLRVQHPTRDPAIVFAWSQPNDANERQVLFDDGHFRRIHRDQWDDVWSHDATARRTHSLPQIMQPSWDAKPADMN